MKRLYLYQTTFKKFVYKNFILLVFLSLTLSCSRSQLSSKKDIPAVFFLNESQKTGQSTDEISKEYLTLSNKDLVLLPVYSDLEYNKLSFDDVSRIFEITKRQLDNLDIDVKSKNYADYSVYSEQSEEVKVLNSFQQIMYDVSISDRALSSQISQLQNARLLLNTQIDYWPDKNSALRNQLRIQMRVIDGPSGLVIWQGIGYKNSDSNQTAQIFQIATDIIKNLLLDLKGSLD